MKRLAVTCAFLFLSALVPGAHAADCGTVRDDLSQAISGNLNMSADMRASMMRMAAMSYDHCMIGNTKDSQHIRELIMAQLKEHLGQR